MEKYSIILTLLLRVGILFLGCDSAVKCRNEDGIEVDWYILYKLPQAHDGLKYLYLDENTTRWSTGRKQINDASGPLANTLEPLFQYKIRQTEDFGFMLYNDQPPSPHKTASSSFAHSKGLLMLDRQTGVWLSHSTPKFPEGFRRNNFWPNSGDVNAQTFICVTYAYEAFKDIGLQLKYIHVYLYDYFIPKTLHNELRCVTQTLCYPKTEPWFRVQHLVSLRGHRFISFAKYTRFGDDLYSGLLVYMLNQDLYVKSWGSMKRPLPSNCSIPQTVHHVYNVEEVLLTNYPLSNTVDHSKWCVASSHWSCIADMNREMSQMSRGGGAICIYNDTVHKAFRKAVGRYKPCQEEL